MWSWDAIGGIVALLTSVSLVADRLLLARQKNSLQMNLLIAWNWLDDIRTPDFPGITAQHTIKLLQRVIGRKLFSFRMILIGLPMSIILTTFAFFISLPGFNIGVNNINERVDVFSVIFSHPSKYLSTYGLNFVFDLITLLITLNILHRIQFATFRSFTTLLALDIFFAALLAPAVVLASLAFVDIYALQQAPEWHENFAAWYIGIDQIINPSSYSTGSGTKSYAAYSATTAIPTLLFCAILFIGYISKFVTELIRSASVHILEGITENDKDSSTIFTILAGIISALLIILKIAFEAINSLY